MRVPTVLFVPLLLPACSFGYPPHEAFLDREFEVPAAELEGLSCQTHNGLVRVTGTQTDRAVVRARLRARGWSPEEAEANVQRIELRHEVEGDWLHVRWTRDEDYWTWEDASPDVSFTIEVPARLAGRISTHNGQIEVRGLDGDLAVSTHNGQVLVSGAFPRVEVETHNGNVRAELSGSGPVEGRLGTHNGGVRVEMGARSANVTAHTHKGGIVVDGGAGRAHSDGGTLRATVGEGGGDFRIVTHNGEVVVR